MINNFMFTLTTFTRVPGLKVEFNDKNTKYLFLFLPLIGLVIGILTYLFYLLISLFISELIIKTLLLLVFNILITGGIHLDGFLDSMDAINSHQSKEKKKIIIKDSLIGAFALISFSVLSILMFCALYYLIKLNLITYIILIPMLVRAFLLIVIRNSKLEQDDLVSYFCSPTILKSSYLYILIYFILGLLIILLLKLSIILYLIICLTLIIFSLLYLVYYKLHFNELNGDLCGLYICSAELFLIAITCFFN